MLNKPTPDAANRSCPYPLQYKKSIPGSDYTSSAACLSTLFDKIKDIPCK